MFGWVYLVFFFFSLSTNLVMRVMKMPCRRLIFMIFTFSLATSGYFALFYVKNTFVSPMLMPNSAVRSGFELESELVGTDNSGTQKCIHPTLELWHPALKKYFTNPAPLRCAEDENWVYVSNGTFQISNKAQQKHGNITCQYVPKIRGATDSDVENGAIESPMRDGTPLITDFFQAICSATDGTKYSNLHSGIAVNKELHKPFVKADLPKGALGLNILMFGFDSTSRMTWMRNLPKSHAYLVNELQGIVLKGYNIVGDGTPQALLPILTGMTEVELPEARRGRLNAKNVDGHPWIWKDLKRLNYVTQWGEDGAAFGTFTYRMLGFKNQPVDHYMRPFYIEAEKLYGANRPYCLGSQPRHLNMLNWIKEFFEMYPNKPKFSFVFHSEFTHGGYSEVRVVDEDLKDFLHYMNTKGYLNNTLLVLMADHGARFQAVRQTVQGKYEERMPYFSLRFPEWFVNKYPKAIENLKANADRLTTPFDIHETFKDIVNFTEPGVGDVTKRGISLFKRIPEERTCHHAGIETHWCACLDWKAVQLDSENVQAAANKLVDTINQITEFHRDSCALLHLENITVAERYTPNIDLLKFKQSKDTDGRKPDLSDNMMASEVFYQVTIITNPGRGQFEATLKYLVQDSSFTLSDRDISRINKYGSDPQCVADKYPHLRPYCYCTR